MNRYLIINEYGGMYLTNEITDDIKEGEQDGELTVVDIVDKKELFLGVWTDIRIGK